MKLSREVFLQVVKNTPLVSIDLIVRDGQGKVLLGRRANEPARGSWFVPGGSIRKDERLDQAFRRICRAELGFELEREQAQFLGVYEHLYPANFAEEPGFGTHYVVLAYEFPLPQGAVPEPDGQHDNLQWFPVPGLLREPAVHPNVKAYFTES